MKKLLMESSCIRMWKSVLKTRKAVLCVVQIMVQIMLMVLIIK